MKAIILAAGIGSRIKEITELKPKCLIDIGNKNILQRQIESFLQLGVEEIIIIGGYKIEMITEFCNSLAVKNIKIIENIDYLETNNMYSLFLAKKETYGENFLLINGDVVFDDKIAEVAIENEGSSIAFYDSGNTDEEELKLETKNGCAYAILPKGPIAPNCDGSTIGMFLFNEESSKYLFDDIETVIYKKGLKNEWFEMSLNDVFKQCHFSAINIKDTPWIEIDTFNDLKIAEKLFN
jgi:choline kinase